MTSDKPDAEALLQLFGVLYQQVGSILLNREDFDKRPDWEKAALINYVLDTLSDPQAALEQRKHEV